mgnify:CR=1 FL=1
MYAPGESLPMAAWMRVGSPASLISDADCRLGKPGDVVASSSMETASSCTFRVKKEISRNDKASTALVVMVAPSDTRPRHVPIRPNLPESTRAICRVCCNVVQYSAVPCICQDSSFPWAYQGSHLLARCAGLLQGQHFAYLGQTRRDCARTCLLVASRGDCLLHFV